MYLAAVPAAVVPGGSMAMGAATGATTNFVLLPLVFIVSLLASAIWELDRLGHLSSSRLIRAPAFASRAGQAPTRSEDPGGSDQGVDEAGDPWLAPRLEGACHIAMCITMGYMLILML
jgi:hypothetical protein